MTHVYITIQLHMENLCYVPFLVFPLSCIRVSFQPSNTTNMVRVQRLDGKRKMFILSLIENYNSGEGWGGGCKLILAFGYRYAIELISSQFLRTKMHINIEKSIIINRKSFSNE